MEIPHPVWTMTAAEAIAEQKRLAANVRCEDDFGPVRTIAGVDVSTQRFGQIGYAAVVVLTFPELEVVETTSAQAPLALPYIPGLLSFREIPVLLPAWEKLKTLPDLIMVDGHGIAHPRRLGIASHLGLLLDRPAIGCGKSILRGTYADLGPARGSRAPLCDRGERIGYAVRTKDRVNPVFVSCGHRVSAESAVDWVLACNGGYRLPEPTRQAHLASNAARREALR